MTKPGYALSWSPALPETMPQSDSTYTAVWTAGTSTAYTLTCYKQDADTGLYEPTVETLYGTTDTAVTAERSFDHYTLNADLSTPRGVIAGDGSLALSLYFDLETLTVTFDAGEGGTLTDEAEKTFRYGQRFSVQCADRHREHGADRALERAARGLHGGALLHGYDRQYAVCGERIRPDA